MIAYIFLLIHSIHLYSVDATNFVNNKALQNILDGFLSTDVTELSISQAFDLLIDLQKKLNKIKLEVSNEKKRLSIWKCLQVW